MEISTRPDRLGVLWSTRQQWIRMEVFFRERANYMSESWKFLKIELILYFKFEISYTTIFDDLNVISYAQVLINSQNL